MFICNYKLTLNIRIHCEEYIRINIPLGVSSFSGTKQPDLELFLCLVIPLKTVTNSTGFTFDQLDWSWRFQKVNTISFWGIYLITRKDYNDTFSPFCLSKKESKKDPLLFHRPTSVSKAKRKELTPKYFWGSNSFSFYTLSSSGGFPTSKS